ncbi:squalene--hopene cyclase [Massilia sp. LXY-6]|uniref:phosphorylase family protein n=1 Tax=Massilia sp. LXY-6 TaxID=3379823 RepID=UPI003EE3AEE3
MRPATAKDAPLIVVCGLGFEAAIAAGPGMLTVCGPGPRRVAERLDALLAGHPEGAQGWAGILSFGCAGGIDPSLQPGACVLASGVWTAAGPIAVDQAWSRALLARLPQAREGLLAGLDAPLATRSAKARLWREAGVRACDMESHAAALAARRHGLPFAACRVVLDPAGRSLPDCALLAMREDGGTDTLALLRGLAATPREIVPLAALALDAWRARHTLRRLRRQLGAALAPPR